ncbi:hypothetical protein MRX96_033077 [Rhipicephalus microplus]
MGVMWSCCECPEDHCESSELYGVMARQEVLPNYLSSSIDSMALLPQLGRPPPRRRPRRASGDSSPSESHSTLTPEQSGASSPSESQSPARPGQSGAASPSGIHSPVRPEQARRSPQRTSPQRTSPRRQVPRRLPPSAAIPIPNPEEPGPSQASVAGSPQLHSPVNLSHYSKTELMQMALMRRIEVSPEGATFTEPRMGTIFEESAETEQVPVAECPSSQDETTGSGQYTTFPTLDEETNLDTPEKD